MSLYTLSLENSLLGLLVRFSVNLFVLFILIRIIYYRYSRKPKFLFSFFIMGITIFLLVSLLEMIEVKLGMALGLFAIFAILRFRTRNLPVKEMTYIFTVIGVSVINSQAHVTLPVFGAIMVNSIILLSTYLLEYFLKKRALSSLLVIYGKLELLTPENKKPMLKDLTRITGQNIEKVKIRKIDSRRGKAEVMVYFLAKETD